MFHCFSNYAWLAVTCAKTHYWHCYTRTKKVSFQSIFRDSPKGTCHWLYTIWSCLIGTIYLGSHTIDTVIQGRRKLASSPNSEKVQKARVTDFIPFGLVWLVRFTLVVTCTLDRNLTFLNGVYILWTLAILWHCFQVNIRSVWSYQYNINLHSRKQKN